MRPNRIVRVVYMLFVGSMLLVTGRNLWLRKLGSDILAASQRGDFASVRALIARNPQLARVKDPVGFTALSYVLTAPQNPECPDTALALIHAGADPNVYTRYYGRALRSACQTGSLPLVAALLDAGANLNEASIPGNLVPIPPLCQAVERSDTRLARFLIQRGADPNAPCDVNLMPLGLAARSGKFDFVRLLLDAGANPVVCPPSGSPVLRFLPPGKRETQSIGAALLAAGAQIDAGQYGFTPLIAAIWGGEIEPVRFLLKNGANPNIPFRFDGAVGTGGNAQHIVIRETLPPRFALERGHSARTAQEKQVYACIASLLHRAGAREARSTDLP